jgi:hypothetical protein
MAKWANDAVMDAAFDYIDQSDKMTVCNAQPTTYTEANATFALADVAMTPDTDFTKANGDVSGRKVTVAAKSTVTVDTTGTATHIALIRTGDATLRYVTTCTSQALTAGNTVNIPAWDIEIADPT